LRRGGVDRRRPVRRRRQHRRAPPGTYRGGRIVLSEVAYDLLRPALGLEAHDLGLLRLKNVPRPIRAYAVAPEPGTIALMPPRPPEAILPSLAVVPLQNLSGDPADDYFADGIVEDIVVSLAGLHELLVISRGSTLAYRGRQPDPREVGRALGVRYVLLGSVRRAGATVRIATQLCGVETGASLWSDRADAARDALFEVQDEIVGRVVAGLSPQVRAAELKRALRKRPDGTVGNSVFGAVRCR
jgi:adenylate cyclase